MSPVIQPFSEKKGYIIVICLYSDYKTDNNMIRTELNYDREAVYDKND